MKRLTKITIYAALMSLSVSCLMQQEDIFDKTPAERTDEFIAEYREILTSADMWMLEYYPASDKRYGGYTYFLSFDQEKVTAYFQLASDVTESMTSLYKIVADDGVTLSYDTYNEYLHYFSEPNSMSYQGLLGDYEFRILGKSADEKEIYIRGRKSGNEFALRQFDGNVQEYLSKSAGIMDAFGMYDGFELDLANSHGAECLIRYNTVTMGYIDLRGTYQETTIPFCFTDTGVRFTEEFKIGGVPYDGLTWDDASASLVSDDGAVKLSCMNLPLTMRKFDSDDITGFEQDASGYFGEYNYYARNVFDDDVQRRFISKVTFADSDRPDTEPDENGIADEFMEASGMFPSIPDARITFSVYDGIIYTIENYLGLVTRPSGDKYYIKMVHGSTLTDGFYPGYDYLMIGGYVGDGAIAFVCDPNYSTVGIDQIFLSCYVNEDDIEDFNKSEGGAEWHADLLFIRTELDDTQNEGSDVEADGRSLMGNRLESIRRMAIQGPRNYVETQDGHIKTVIDACRR